MPTTAFRPITTKKEAADVLRSFEDRLSNLMSRAEPLPPSKPDADACREQLRELKADLAQARKLLEVASQTRGLTQIEAAFVAPAIRSAAVRLRIRVNSRPGRAWIGPLYDASGELGWMLSQLGD